MKKGLKMFYASGTPYPAIPQVFSELDNFKLLRVYMVAIIQVMESTIAVRDPYTVGHQRRATQLACLIAAEMDLPNPSLEDLNVAGRLHDLGKIGVPGEILSKPGKLTGAEFSVVKSHPQAGYEILQPLKLPQQIAQIILQHHERLDGSGYPQGLKGSEILLEAKILAVADVVDSICSHRPYQPSLGLDQALEEIVQFRGTLYDVEAVNAYLRVFEKAGDHLISMTRQHNSV
jgi:HD-GYP domain-containing protein (c-di-GMP phosphodiesterase class II)